MSGKVWENVKKFSITFTQAHKRNKLKRYLLPIVLIIFDLFFRFALQNFIPDEASYHLLTIVVVLSAWYGGLGPGLFAVLLATIIDGMVFLPDFPRLGILAFVPTGLFAIGGLIISLISEARQQSDRQKDEFIGIASHELKNPLTSVKMYTQLLLKNAEQKKDEMDLKYLGRVNSQIDSTILMINDLLDLTRIESGRLTYTYEQFFIDELVKDAIDEQQIVTKTHKIQLQGRSDVEIVCDIQRIRQVIVNLLTNAVKYSPDADTVVVRIKRKESGVEISVRDFGIGIPKEQLNKVFDRFFRASSAEGSSIQGLGLGLHIASRIVNRHRGKIWVTSTIGKGTTFYLHLPGKASIKS